MRVKKFVEKSLMKMAPPIMDISKTVNLMERESLLG